MTKVLPVCESKEKGTRRKTIAERYLSEDYRLAGDSRTDVCELVWRIATDGK